MSIFKGKPIEVKGDKTRYCPECFYGAEKAMPLEDGECVLCGWPSSLATSNRPEYFKTVVKEIGRTKRTGKSHRGTKAPR